MATTAQIPTTTRAIPVGTRIYYTGDAENDDGYGLVRALRHHRRWKETASYDITMDDGRQFLGIFPTSFAPQPGQRFWTVADWNAKRHATIERIEAAAPGPR